MKTLQELNLNPEELEGGLYDLDDSLIKIEDLYTVAYRRLAQKYGRCQPGDDADEKLLQIVRYDPKRGMIGKGEPRSTEIFMEEFELESIEDTWLESRDRLMAEVAEIQLEEFRKAEYMPGVEAFVTHMQNRGIPQAIATASAGGKKTDAKLEGKEVLQHIPVVTGGGGALKDLRTHYNINPDLPDDKLNKPQPFIFWHAGEQIKVPLYRCFTVEDSLIGLESAIQSGARLVIFVPNTHEPNIKERAEELVTELQAEDQVIMRDSLEGLEQELAPYLKKESHELRRELKP